MCTVYARCWLLYYSRDGSSGIDVLYYYVSSFVYSGLPVAILVQSRRAERSCVRFARLDAWAASSRDWRVLRSDDCTSAEHSSFIATFRTYGQCLLGFAPCRW